MLWRNGGPPTRVLVVDDDPLTRMLLEDVLALGGYAVRSAADGADGLTLLRAWRPAAVVLDVMMPDVDARVFRAVQFDSPAIADVPVLLLSATRADALRAIADDLGAAAWLPKPFDVDEVVAAVGRLVAPRQRSVA
jgi:DNA-binding response OmpR family regulator